MQEKQNKTKFKNSFSWCRDSQPKDTLYNDIWACNRTPHNVIWHRDILPNDTLFKDIWSCNKTHENDTWHRYILTYAAATRHTVQ